MIIAQGKMTIQKISIPECCHWCCTRVSQCSPEHRMTAVMINKCPEFAGYHDLYIHEKGDLEEEYKLTVQKDDA